MPESANFNVSVLVTMRNRIAQGLRMIGREFSSTEGRVRALQRSLNDLQTRHGIYAQRTRVTQAIERQGTAGLQQRLALTQSLAASEQTVRQAKIESMQAESAERSQTERIQAEQLKGLQRRTALQKVAARDRADAQRIQIAQQQLQDSQAAKQLQIAELQGNIQRRNAMAQLRATEAENALLRQQNALRERQAAIAAQQAQTRVAGKLGAIGLAAGAIGAAGFAGYEFAKAGLPVSMYLQQIRMAGNLTARQAAGIPSLAMRLSAATGGQETYKESLRALIPLIGMYGLKRAQQMAPLFQFAGLESTYGLGNDLTQMTLGAAQALQSMHANTTGRQASMLGAMTRMLTSTGGIVTPEQFAERMRMIGAATPNMPFAQRLKTAEITGMLGAKLGPQRGLTASGEASLFSALLTPRDAKDIALQQLLKRYGLAKTAAGRTPANILEAIAHAPKGFTLPQRMMAGGHLVTLQALQNALQGGALQRLEAAFANNVTPQQALAKSLMMAQPAMTRLATSLDNFAAVTGSKLAKLLTHPATATARKVATATTYLQHHTALQTDLHGAALLVKDSPLVLAAKALIEAAGRGIAATPKGVTPEGQAVHVHVHLDGKEISHSTTKHTVQQLKGSALAFGAGSSPIMSPHVVAPKLTP